MALHSLRRLSCGGDALVAEWETTTVSQERLDQIAKEYDQLVALGMTPADVTDKKDELVPGARFNPDADTLMIPRFQGGSQ